MNQTILRLVAGNRLPLLFVGIVLLAGCAGPRPSSSARVQPLDESLRELKAEFNRDISNPRVLALFSPTCGGCLYGARALQHEVAAAGKMAADPQMLVVWLAMLDTDNEHEARKSARRFDFPGAWHFYDAGRQTSARLMVEQFPNAVAARLNAEQAEIQHARASAREKLLAKLRGLPIQERLEHIAWDDTRSLSCYRADLAVCTAEHLKQLDPITKERFTAKLRERKKGPWQKLAKRLEVGFPNK